MSNEHDTPTDSQISEQLRSYADAIESAPAVTRPLHRPGNRARMAVIGVAAAAVVALVAGLIAIYDGSADEQVTTPAGLAPEQPEGTKLDPATDEGVVANCPGRPITSEDELVFVSEIVSDSREASGGGPGIHAHVHLYGLQPTTAIDDDAAFGAERGQVDSGDAEVTGTTTSKDEAASSGSWLEVSVSEDDPLAAADPAGATPTMVSMCDPTSASQEPVEIEAVRYGLSGAAQAGIVVTATPVDASMPTLYVQATGTILFASDSMAVEDTLRTALATLRWKPWEAATPAPESSADETERGGAGTEITIDSVGPYRVGQTVPEDAQGVETGEFGGVCGHWNPDGSDWFDRRSGVSMLIIREDLSQLPTVGAIYTRDPAYVTTWGTYIGMDLELLRRIHGDDLVVDRVDGWENPTDGLVAGYTDVAAIRQGDRAITYHLRDDVVDQIKVSSADAWGDDEGCA
ncbi:MAG: hypothetical protein ACK5O2_06465 [Microthrixaceae bacterium]